MLTFLLCVFKNFLGKISIFRLWIRYYLFIKKFTILLIIVSLAKTYYEWVLVTKMLIVFFLIKIFPFKHQ